MTARLIQARLDARWLIPVHRGVYRLPGGSPPEQGVLAPAQVVESALEYALGAVAGELALACPA